MLVCALFKPFALWRACWLEPSLKDKPLVAVEKGRVTGVSCVAAKAGVETGVAVEGARARCEQLTVIEPNPVTLQQAWEDLLAELYSFTDRVEPAELGRVFLELTGQEARHIAETFQARLARGSSQEYAHLLALVAKEGEARLEPFQTERQALGAVPVHVLEALNLSKKTVERLAWLGVSELKDLKRWSRGQLELYLGEEARVLIRYLHGPYRTEVRRYVPPVVLCESHSFEEAVLEPWQLEPVMEGLAQRLTARLGDRAATRLTLTAEVGGLAFSGSRVSKQPLRDESAFLRLASLALEDSGVQGLGVDRLELALSGLHRPSVQGGLWQHREDVDKAVRAVEARFPGMMLKFEELDPYMPAPEFSHRLIPLGAKEVTHEASQRRSARRTPAQCERAKRLTPH